MSKKTKILFIIFGFLTVFWLLLQLGIFDNMKLVNHTYYKFFGAIYGITAFIGGLWGLSVSKKWGGWKSIIGRAVILFSLGLLAQEFGQLYLSYKDYAFNIQGEYPSIADIGFFGSIPFYTLGVIFLAQASGVKIGLRSFANKIQAVIIPALMLLVCYLLFLHNYSFDLSNPIKTFLDFGYPLGQAIYVSFAVLTYLLSKGVLGGSMKKKILLILFALVVQFLSDYIFLYQSNQGTWSVGRINDYMYLLAYFLMTIGLLQFSSTE